MPFLYRIKFLATGEEVERSDLSFFFYYVKYVKEETTIRVKTALIWCCQCNELTIGEYIEPLETLDKYIEDLDSPDSDRYQQLYRLFRDWRKKQRIEMIASVGEEAKERRRWLVERAAPPKCLMCGTTDIIHLRLEEAVATPVGPISMEGIGICTIGGSWRYYSPEGDRIEYTPPPQPDESPHSRSWWQFWR